LLAAQPALGGELPRPDHIVIVIEENKSFSQIIGNKDAPWINELARRGALLRTIEDEYGLLYLMETVSAQAVKEAWAK
jgi:hypothetical protein